MKFKKAQIGIFIIIALILIIGLIFVLNSDFEDKSDDINSITNIKDKNDDEMSLVKNKVDSCLEHSLEIGLLRAGLKGGLIYDGEMYSNDKLEYTFGSIVPDKTYSNDLLTNLDLKKIELESKVLVYGQDLVVAPKVYGNITEEDIFSHTLDDDLKRLVYFEFGKCIDFKSQENIYGFDYIDYYGNITSINLNKGEIEVGVLNVSKGDKILLDIDNINIWGTVSEIDGKIVIELDNILPSDVNLEVGMGLISYNKIPNLNIIYNDEDVMAELTYPVIVFKGDDKKKFTETTVSVDVRVSQLQAMAKKMIWSKIKDRSLDFSDSKDVKKALSTPYYQSTEYKDFDLITKTILDEDSHKKRVYSLIDKDFRLIGSPYVFNVGYENIAPVIDVNVDSATEIDFYNIESPYVIDFGEIPLRDNKNIILLDSTYEHEPSFDLGNLYYDISDVPNFLTVNDQSSGDITFSAARSGTFRFPFTVTDGETIREYMLKFRVPGACDSAASSSQELTLEKNVEEVVGVLGSQYKLKYLGFNNGMFEIEVSYSTNDGAYPTSNIVVSECTSKKSGDIEIIVDNNEEDIRKEIKIKYW